MDKFLTAKEVAEKLGLTPKRIREWVKEGKIPATILPGGGIRFKESVIASWVDKRTTKARQYSTVTQ